MVKVKRNKGFNTDTLMKNLYVSLVRDFRSVMGSDYKEQEVQLLADIPEFRKIQAPDRLQAPPHVFKKEAQLEGLFKRYRFEHDSYTDKELEKKTFQSFIETQMRLCEVLQRPEIPERTFRVIQNARRIIKSILEGFDPDDAGVRGRFSTRATYGNPARDAYLDCKVADDLSGSPDHVKWFSSHLRAEGFLRSVILKCQAEHHGIPLDATAEPRFNTCLSLDLVGVPKSWKSLRLISPNTLIGSYYTYGLGSIFVEALKQEGLDITKLQFIHKILAKQASEDKEQATGDLSSASESFLWTLICRLLPRKWVRALNRGRLKYFTYQGRTYHYLSFMAMGIGFTFPLQTLLFYALVKATCELAGIKGRISVYGDDLIYPTSAHPYVKQILADVGMVMNPEKTFVSSHFRESCGGDFYHGVDVRPFQPEGEYQQLGARKYEALLYKTVNGLCERWSEEEIPFTLMFLKYELWKTTLLIKQVPPSYPDYAGWKTHSLRPLSEGFSPVQRIRMAALPKGEVTPLFCKGLRFTHLVECPNHRYVSFEDAYYYDWFRQAEDADDPESIQHLYFPRSFCAMSFERWLRSERIRRALKIKNFFHPETETLVLLKAPRQPKRYRDSTGRRITKMLTASTCKLEAPSIQTKSTDTISDWI